jgi:hypothetical protein
MEISPSNLILALNVGVGIGVCLVAAYLNNSHQQKETPSSENNELVKEVEPKKRGCFESGK